MMVSDTERLRLNALNRLLNYCRINLENEDFDDNLKNIFLEANRWAFENGESDKEEFDKKHTELEDLANKNRKHKREWLSVVSPFAERAFTHVGSHVDWAQRQFSKHVSNHEELQKLQGEDGEVMVRDTERLRLRAFNRLLKYCRINLENEELDDNLKNIFFEANRWALENRESDREEFDKKHTELEDLVNKNRKHKQEWLGVVSPFAERAFTHVGSHVDWAQRQFSKHVSNHEVLQELQGEISDLWFDKCSKSDLRVEMQNIRDTMSCYHVEVRAIVSDFQEQCGGIQKLMHSITQLEDRLDALSNKSTAEIQQARHSINCLQEQCGGIQKLRDSITQLDDNLDALGNKSTVEIQQVRDSINCLQDQCGDIQKLRDCITHLQGNLDALDNKSAYFTLYKTQPVPNTKEEVFDALKQMLNVYKEVKEYTYSEEQINTFVQDLLGSIDDDAKPPGMSDVQWVGARLWTSPCTIAGTNTSLCHILTEMNYTDNIRILTCGGMTLQKSLNKVLVSRSSAARTFPPNGKSHRGTGIPRCQLDFFIEGKKYRAAAPLASSFSEEVAQDFLDGVEEGFQPVHFIFEWQKEASGAFACDHAFYVDEISAVRGEREIVLAGYSVLEVSSVLLQGTATVSSPHVITCKVMKDNRKHPEYLPVAKWH